MNLEFDQSEKVKTKHGWRGSWTWLSICHKLYVCAEELRFGEAPASSIENPSWSQEANNTRTCLLFHRVNHHRRPLFLFFIFSELNIDVDSLRGVVQLIEDYRNQLKLKRNSALDMEVRWDKLTEELIAPDIRHKWWTRICETLANTKQRKYYYNLEYLERRFNLYDSYVDRLSDPTAVALAMFFQQ